MFLKLRLRTDNVGKMKICQNCFQEFDDAPYPGVAITPAGVLGEIFLEGVGGDDPRAQDARQLCPVCKDKVGIVNLLGFGS